MSRSTASQWYIRRARPEDARAIHDVHMRSIREVCSKDHTLAEVMAWGGRPYDEAARIHTIEHHFVWVVQRVGVMPSEVQIEKLHDESIAGFGVMAIRKGGDAAPSINGREAPSDLSPSETNAHIYALYFGSEILGLGLGRELVELMMDEAHKAGAKTVTLESTLTAHGFYKNCGFVDSGPMTSVEINGERIRCYPMIRKLELTPTNM